MCACEPGWTCAKCEPRRAHDLDIPDWREREQEAWNSLISMPDFDRGLDR